MLMSGFILLIEVISSDVKVCKTMFAFGVKISRGTFTNVLQTVYKSHVN